MIRANYTTVIEMSGVGPITTLRTIPINPLGGVTVLRGGNGTGKTCSLDAVRAHLGAKVKIEANDDTGKGEIVGFGRKTTIAKQIRRTKQDDVAVRHIEDRFDLSTIVDPGMKDPESNDLARLRALVSLGRFDVQAERFAQITDGLDVDISDAVTERDLVSRVGAVKKVLQSRARDYEKMAESEKQKMLASETLAGGVDPASVPSIEEIQSKLSAAISRRYDLISKTNLAVADATNRSRAEKAIAESQQSYSGLSSSQITKKVVAARREYDAAVEALQQARNRLAEAERAISDLVYQQESAAAHEESIAKWQEILANPVVMPPSKEELYEADMAVQKLESSMKHALQTQQAAEHAKTARQRRKVMQAYQTKAESLRKACEAADGLLGEALAVPCLKLEAGRLIHINDDGSEELFDRLSDGLRWAVAIKVGARAVSTEDGDGTCLLILCQDAWQHLDPDRRDMVNDLAVGEKVCILTAEATSGPLRACIYGEQDPWKETLELSA